MGGIPSGIDPVTKKVLPERRQQLERFAEQYDEWLAEMLMKYGDRDIPIANEDQRMVDHAMKCQHIWFDEVLSSDRICITKYGKDYLFKK